MADFRRVSEDFAVSPQLTEADVAEAARAGFRTLVNNRPDGEEPGQPSGAQVAAWAERHGLAYLAFPVPSPPTLEAIEAQEARQREALAGARDPVLGYCRTGTRSIMVWALGQSRGGRQDRERLVAAAAQAGYDLSRFPL